MNYLKEILTFENWIEYNSGINKSDIRLWYTLVHTANRFAWKEFTISISALIFKSKLSKSDIYRSRNKLKQLGLIDFKERSGNQCAIYKINSVVSLFGTQNETSVDTQAGTPFDTPSATSNAPNSGNINKIKTKNININENKDISRTLFEIYNNCDEHMLCEHVCESTKSVCQRKSTYRINGKNYCNQHSKEILKNIESCYVKQSKKPKQAHGEFQNVMLTNEEFDKLKARFGEQTDGYIERLSNYIASTGKRYKSHYATILNWVQKDKQNNRIGGESYGNAGKSDGRKLCTEYPE